MISESDRLTIEALVQDMLERNRKRRGKIEYHLADPDAVDLTREREYIREQHETDIALIYPDWDYITHK